MSRNRGPQHAYLSSFKSKNLGCVVQFNIGQTSWILMEYPKLSISISRDMKRRDLLRSLDRLGAPAAHSNRSMCG